METVNTFVILTIAAASFVATSSSGIKLVRSEHLTGPLRHMEFFNDKLYVGGKNKIYKLDMNLSISLSGNTCEGTEDCDNINKVLVIDKNTDSLVVCGTGLGGRCDVFNTSLVNMTSHYFVKDPLNVATDIDRPAQAMINDHGHLVIAVTFGNGIVARDKNSFKTYNYALSRRKMPKLDTFIDISTRAGLNLQIKGSLEDYVIYYKSSFQNNGYSYFVTVQKDYVGGDKYVSKLVRICQNDTTYDAYTDIIIQCQDEEGTTYNIIQNALITNTEVDKSDQIFIGTFSKSGHPSDWIICREELKVLNDKVIEAKKKFAFTCLPADNDRRYLPDVRENGTCIKEEGNYKEDEFICMVIVNNYKYIIGEITANLTVGYKEEQSNGVSTALHAAFQDTKELVIMIGTTEGQLILLNYNRTNSLLDKYSVTDVSPGEDINEIFTTKDLIYVLSDSKVHLYSNTDCSEFKTCKDTIAGRNPLCGWCVFEQKATRKSKCTTSDNQKGWLPSLDKCIQLTVEPSGTSVNAEKEITVTATQNIPSKRDGDTYKCLFESKRFSFSNQASREGVVFKCLTPKVKAHTDAVLKIMTSNVMLAEASFLFYQCSTFKTCKDCVSTEGSMCTWSLTKPECREPGQSNGIVHGGVDQCPRLEDNSDLYFIPSGVNSQITMRGSNLPNTSSFWCYIEDSGEDVQAMRDDDYIACNVTVVLKDTTSLKKKVRMFVKYGESVETRKDLDDDHMLTVTVYSCVNLAYDCSHCKALNKSRYSCKWCSGSCQQSAMCSGDVPCPAPFIKAVIPSDGPVGGQTRITVEGTNLGTTLSEVTSVKIEDYECSVIQNLSFPENNDFEVDVPNRIECKIEEYKNDLTEKSLSVNVTVKDKHSNLNVTYSFKAPNITRINPSFGPKLGGTNITLSGDNLGIGNRNWIVLIGSRPCHNVMVQQVPDSNLFTIECVTKNYSDVGNKTATLSIDENYFTGFYPTFEVLTNPNMSRIEGKKGGFLKGGTILTILGTDMDHANVGVVKLEYKRDKEEEKCKIESNSVTKCLVPVAPKSLQEDVMAEVRKSARRTKREACVGCIVITVKLDGVEKNFTIKYVQNPTLEKLNGDGNVLLYETNEHQLLIKGDSLDLVTTENDFKVTIGLENCTRIELTRDTLRCSPPNKQPSPADPKNKYPEVVVNVGNIHERVGYLLYKEELELTQIIAFAVGGGVLLILAIFIAFGIVKYRKMGKKARAYEKSLSDMEMEIKNVVRQEFLDMHTTMSTVNKNLVEQGFPYHSYQQFACNVMFNVDYLWTEPVVSNSKMTDDERLKANRGMESLEALIYNKFFLVSVISTMENEKRFFIREKSNLAGNLCAVLMGRMDYLDEILRLLMNNLVQDSPARKHKTLFRRCESITEKLLSNWLSLCLYPHVKSHSGSPLYLLYMATQKTMESGPIDAVTGDAKYTLSEEKLLKKWSSSMDEDNGGDLKFEAKTLTLNVVVDNGDEIFKCKVLDCDTISQVKNKCLNQIYVNFPASRLPVGANDLALEWHEGFGGTLKLRDEDNTSKRDGKWVRLNTLAHYNVKDESNMALIDPHSTDINNQEDYVNLANINMDGVCDGSIDSSQPLAPHEDNPHECEYWHLVKKEEESSKQGKGAITELYLNRLFTTKQSLMEYMRPLFDIILDHDKCPPPTKFLYDYLDELGEKYKVDGETVYAWKSHSYAIRVWASLMKMPNLLFDVSIPSFMDDNLAIISQVFIESFSLTTQKFTKDTPPQKLIFHHERNHYKDRVKEFYKNVKVDSQDLEELRQYIADVNRLQQATEFNKVSALYRFYKQLKPYFEDILENLATNKEASNLQLDRKLEQVIAIMEEDEE